MTGRKTCSVCFDIRAKKKKYIPKTKKTRMCEICGKEFKTWTSTQRYCSKKCRSIAYIPPMQVTPEVKDRAARGSMTELLVCVELMGKGYEVFRNMSPAGSCDLVVLREGRLLRVECKTTTLNIKTNHWSIPSFDMEKCDVVAILISSGLRYLDSKTRATIDL